MISELFSYTISALLIGIEYMSFYNLNMAFFQKKEDSYKIFMGGILAWLILSNNIFIDHTIRMIFSFIMILCVSKLSFECDWKKSSIIALAQIVLVFAYDYLILFILMIMLNISYQELMANPITFIIFGFTSKLMLYITSYIFCKIIKLKNKKSKLNVTQWVEIILFSLCSMYSLYLIMDYSLKTNIATISLIVGTMFIIICNIAIFFIINKIEDDNELKNEQAILREQVKAQIENYEALAENYQTQRKLTHDFKSHIEAIKGMAINNDSQGVIKYIQGTSENIESESLIVNSNHPNMDMSDEELEANTKIARKLLLGVALISVILCMLKYNIIIIYIAVGEIVVLSLILISKILGQEVSRNGV